jgi:PQQ-like domain
MLFLLRFAAVLAAALALPAQAQWTPQWTSAWQHPEAFRAAGVQRLRVAADGATFAAIDVTHHGRSHDALARFNADGTFAWLREHESLGVASLELLPGGRIALIATSATPGARIDVRVYDTATGDLAWSRGPNTAQLHFDERDETRHLALDPAGNLLIAGSDGADFVVLRYAPNGDALPAWRADVGVSNVRATSIFALPDGGAIVSGPGDTLDGGFRTVRFDAAGAVAFDDTEPGDIGNPLGPSYLAPTADGGFLVAAAPESNFGVPEATVWKLAADGTRQWTTVLPNPSPSPGMGLDVRGLVATPDGDALVVVDTAFSAGFRLLRLRGSDGRVMLQAQSATAGHPTTFALAPNGRVLVGGYVFSGASGTVTARIAEFNARGAPCRAATDLAMMSAVAAISADGRWTIGGASMFVQGFGSDALLRRYDADGACTDAIFGGGFEAGQ